MNEELKLKIAEKVKSTVHWLRNTAVETVKAVKPDSTSCAHLYLEIIEKYKDYLDKLEGFCENLTKVKGGDQ